MHIMRHGRHAASASRIGRGGGGVGSLAAKPNLYPLDGSYGWQFSGADATARSGAFTDSSYSSPFLTQAGTPWTWQAATGPNGIPSVAAIMTASGTPGNYADNGATFYYGNNNGSPTINQKSIFVRFFYKQSNPFNYDATAGGNNSNWVKFNRYYDMASVNNCTPNIVPNDGSGHSYLGIGWDAWQPADPILNSTYDVNPNVGFWNCYEQQVDFTDPTTARYRVWVNDVLVFDSPDGGRSRREREHRLPPDHGDCERAGVQLDLLGDDDRRLDGTHVLPPWFHVSGVRR